MPAGSDIASLIVIFRELLGNPQARILDPNGVSGIRQAGKDVQTGASGLSTLAEQLNNLVRRFKVDGQETSKLSTKI